jgi:glycerol-3-phosphate acyltransferase PlsY
VAAEGVATAFGVPRGPGRRADLAVWRACAGGPAVRLLMPVIGGRRAVVIAVMAAVGWLDPAYALLFAVPTTLLVEISHIPNIRRLLAGTEPKLGQGGTRRVPGAS